jgi:glycosyltransferase involved in cell wall biosynthesis
MLRQVFTVSVVMPCFLGEYEGAATDRREKLIRAINSFNMQSHSKRELIIVSDGCDETVEVANQFNVNGDIKVVKLDKQPLFSGTLRDEGVKAASGGIICYLDSDDTIGVHHLKTIENHFNNTFGDWAYYNDYIFTGAGKPMIMKDVELQHGSIGTSSIAHTKSIYGKSKGLLGRSKITWKGCDGYGHDWTFIQKLMAHDLNHEKIYGCEYIICHIPEKLDN